MSPSTTRLTIFAIQRPLFLVVKGGPVIFLSLLLFVCQSSASSGIRKVELETFPPLGEVRSQAEPTRLVLAVFDGAGQAVTKARLRVRLQAPEPGWWPTDLPVVDNSRLVEFEVPAPYGTAEWEYFFPIRGVYRLEVTVFDEKGELVHRVFDLPVKESRLKLFYLAIFVLLLFGFGVGAGRWLGRRQGRHVLSDRIGALLIALGVLVPAFAAAAQDDRVAETLIVDRPLAGKATRVRWELVARARQTRNADGDDNRSGGGAARFFATPSPSAREF
jgi:hypothetical protein